MEQRMHKRKYSRKSLRATKRYKQKSRSASRDSLITLPTLDEVAFRIQDLKAASIAKVEALKLMKAAADLFNSTALADKIYERSKEKKALRKFVRKAVREGCNGTLYMCGKPGTGKTATLNCALKSFADTSDITILFFNAMNHKDIKSFLQALSRKLHEIGDKEYKGAKDMQHLVSQIHKCIKSIKPYLYLSF
eukprot:TRINITY_DN7948_c0_g1_i2.p3 TRINITY_DN7948_c0_g1~~TRINITY_DN7948_c0_g1_i2.p3  ORF type:complete len:193 (-),score=44.61 TRINITY_DN7948_c0_g1_i2:978-1556(-)